MPDRLLQFVPFLFVQPIKDSRPKLNFARLLELGIALAAIYYTMSIQMAKMEVEIKTLQNQVQVMDERVFSHISKSE